MGFFYSFSIFLFLFLCVLLCSIVLIQEGKGGGLGASFGGGEGSDSLFGTSTPDIIKKATSWMAVLFVASCVILSLWTARMGRQQLPVPAEEITEVAK